MRKSWYLKRDPSKTRFGPDSSLERLFAPRSIAIVGVSRQVDKLGHRLLAGLAASDFQGRLFAVNRASADGERIGDIALHSSIADVDEDIDVAMIAVSADHVATALESCVDAGVRFAVVAASGFAELGISGHDQQEKLRRHLQGSRTRLLGPNCFGIFDSVAGYNLTPVEHIPQGSIALVSQSGNVAISLFEQARRSGLGFSSCVGVGNQLDIGIGECLKNFASDAATSAVALYVEGFSEQQGREFEEGLLACMRSQKLVVAIKGGRSGSGAAAALSHTASMSSDDRVWDAVLDSYGVPRVRSTEEMMDVLRLAVLEPPTGRRVMIISDGGGDSVMALDAADEAGLDLARVQPDVRKALESLTPPLAPRSPGSNPLTLDTAGGLEDDPMLLAEAVGTACADPGVDCVIVAGIFGGYSLVREAEERCAEKLVELHKQCGPIIVQSAYAGAASEPIRKLKEGGIPLYPTVERLAEALNHRCWQVETAGQAASNKSRSPHADLTPSSRGGSRVTVPLPVALSLLHKHEIGIPPWFYLDSRAQLNDSIGRITYPACLKLADPLVTHKSDVGGVYLDLQDENGVIAAAEDLWNRFPRSPLQVMPMLSPGFEVLLGTVIDPCFGPVVMIGRGGIWAEIEDDAVVRLAPVTTDEALDSIRRLRCWPILSGGREQPKLDFLALANLMVQLSRMVGSEPGLTVEFNPVLVYQSGVAIADVRMQQNA